LQTMTKVTVSICVSDPFPHPMITPNALSLSPILVLFPREQ
jgi:hypothetical protein